MTGVLALAAALAAGGRVEWPEPDRPRLLVPEPLRGRVLADRETVREILRRAAVFRAQAERFIREGQALPFFALPEARGTDAGCLSCAGPLEAGRWARCALCELAVRIALDLSAEGPAF